MPDSVNTDSQQQFARAFGKALQQFLAGKMTQGEAAQILEISDSGLSSYFNDATTGKQKGRRTEASAQVMFLACTKLGFYFDYGGYRIRAFKLGERRRARRPDGV